MKYATIALLAITAFIFLMTSISVADSVPNNHKQILSLPSQCTDDFWVQAGQSLVIDVKNSNILGVSFDISANNQQERAIILPAKTHRFDFSIFGEEPMSWHIITETSSDACNVSLTLYSTWKQGDPPNR